MDPAAITGVTFASVLCFAIVVAVLVWAWRYGLGELVEKILFHRSERVSFKGQTAIQLKELDREIAREQRRIAELQLRQKQL